MCLEKRKQKKSLYMIHLGKISHIVHHRILHLAQYENNDKKLQLYSSCDWRGTKISEK